MNRLAGKVAIVTGAASGLGRADAAALTRAGAKVLLTDVNEAAGQAVAAELNAARPGSAAFAVHDVRDEARWVRGRRRGQAHLRRAQRAGQQRRRRRGGNP